MKKLVAAIPFLCILSLALSQNPVQEVYDTTNAGLIYYSADGTKNPGDKLQNFKSTIGKKGCTIWVGTFGGGIGVFDGLNWTQIESNDVKIGGVSVLSDFVTAICVANNGDVWAGNTGLEGVVRFKTDGTRAVYKSSNTGGQYPATAIEVTKIIEGNSGEIWVATKSHGIVKYNGSSWTNYNQTNSGLPSNNVKTMAYNPVTDEILVGVINGTFSFDGTIWDTIVLQNTWGLAVDGPGNVWIGAGAGAAYGVIVYDGTDFIDTPAASTSMTTNAIAFDSKGNAWIGTSSKGLRKYDGTSLTLIPTPGGSSAAIYDVFVDEDDNVNISSTSFFEIYNDSGIAYCVEFDNTHICYGTADGSSTVIPWFGTSPYTYNWSNSATGAINSGIPGGTYSVTVTDYAGYVATGSTLIVEATTPFSIDTALVRPSPGGFDGQIILTVTGSVPPYTYLWSNGKKTATITNLYAGNYTITVTDSIGCKDTMLIGLYPGTGINEGMPGADLEIIPNPVTGRFLMQFRLEAPIKLNAGIFDLSGRPIRQIFPETTFPEGEYGIPVDIPDLAAGAYQLVLHGNGQQISRKLLIVR